MPNNRRRSKLIAARYAVNKASIRRMPPTACLGAVRLNLFSNVRINDIGVLAQREILSARLFEPPRVYAEFVRDTTDRLAADPTPEMAARLRAGLNLAGYQLQGIADAVSGFVEVPDDDEQPDAARVLDAPSLQRGELLTSGLIENEVDEEALTNASPTARTVRKARQVLELVTQCNEAGKTSSIGVEIFKPTTRLMTVFSELPWLCPPSNPAPQVSRG